MTRPPLKTAGCRVRRYSKGSHSTRQSRRGKVRTTQMMKQKGRRSPESAQAENTQHNVNSQKRQSREIKPERALILITEGNEEEGVK